MTLTLSYVTGCLHRVVLWLSTQHFIVALLTVLGAVLLTSAIWGVLRFLWRHVRPSVDLTKYGLKDGAYAVITGATDGIGKEFAIQLGGKGFNVVIIGRSQDKLTETSTAITDFAKKRGKTVTVAAVQSDLSLGLHAELKHKLDALNVPIGILINNVGQSYDMPAPFAELDFERVKSLIALNVSAAAEMSHWAIPKMLSRRSGLILNVSSGSAIVPAPLLSLYSGTKAFLDTFSVALAHEYKSKGIHVEVISPFHVVSKLSKISRPSSTIPVPSSFVRTTLGKIGRSHTSSTWFFHDIMGAFLHLLPRSTAIGLVHGQLADTRRRAQAKKAREEGKKHH